MFRTNFNSSGYSNSKPKTPLSERKNDAHPYIHYNGLSNQKQQHIQNSKFFQNSKPRELSQTRNNSDYQLNAISNKASQPNNTTINKENSTNQNQYYNQKNYYNQNLPPVTLQQLSQKLQQLAGKVRKNQEAIKNLSLIPLGAFDDINPSKNRESRGSSSIQNNLEIRQLVKSMNELKAENNKQTQKYELNISSMKKVISQLKEQLKSQPQRSQKRSDSISLQKQNSFVLSDDFKFKMENMEFQIKDIYNRVSIEFAKSNQENIEKFVEVTKKQIQNIRDQFGEKIKSLFENSVSCDRELEKSAFGNSISKNQQRLYYKNCAQVLTPSNKIFGGKAITFVIQQHVKHVKTPLISSHIFSLSESSKILNLNSSKVDQISQNSSEEQQCSIKISETLYYVDNQGYLLDENQRYLLNSENKQIILNKQEIQVLKEHRILR